MKTFSLPTLLAILILPLSAANCDGDKKSDDWPQRLPTTQMTIAGNTFTLEIADDPDEQEIGLMKRDSIPQDHGMIFVFPTDEQRTFWMKNTRFDIDIFYVRSDKTLDSFLTMKAYDLSAAPSAGPAKYAIELNTGWINKLKLKPGDKLEIPNTATTQPAK